MSASTPKREDEDKRLIGGCMVLTIITLTGFGLAIFPFFLFNTYELSGLVPALGIGFCCWVIFAALASYFGELAGAGGILASAIGVGAFFYLRHLQFSAFQGARTAPQMDYPVGWIYLIPIIWFLLAIAVVAGVRQLPKRSR